MIKSVRVILSADEMEKYGKAKLTVTVVQREESGRELWYMVMIPIAIVWWYQVGVRVI